MNRRPAWQGTFIIWCALSRAWVEIANETPKKALSGALFWMTTADSMRCFNQP